MKWYFCNDDARPLPFDTPFASANWYDDEALNVELGELPLTIPKWSNGETPPTVNPDHICGTVEQWQDGFPADEFSPGILYDNFGIPFCCYPMERDEDVGDGGLELDGHGELTTNKPKVGNGGLELDGSAKQITPFPKIGDGGLALDGGGLWFTNRPKTGDGGLELDGHGIQIAPQPSIGNGGLELDGHGPHATNGPTIGDGGLELDGSATMLSPVVPSIGNGGLELDGHGSHFTNGPTIGDGGLELDGSATVISGASIAIGDGGLELDGHGELTTNHPPIGDGGLRLDGHGELTTNHPPIGDGALELDGHGELVTNVTPIGNGGLELDGTVIPFTDNGNATCDRALDIRFAVDTLDFLLAPTDQKWFRLPFFTATGDFTMSIDWHGETDSTAEVIVYHGTSCSSQTQDGIFLAVSSPPFVHYTVPEPGFIYVRVFGSASHPTHVTFTCFFT